MRVEIIAVGDTAKHWDGSGFSIGVNDAGRWGHKINHLLVVNHPSKFRKEPERMKIITSTKPDKFFSHTSAWAEYFPKMERIKTTRLLSKMNKGVYYHSQTSPYVAICHAVNIGATKIVLWGVDLITHSVYHDKRPEQRLEVSRYERLVKAISKHGVETYLGAEGSALTFLPIWKN